MLQTERKELRRKGSTYIYRGERWRREIGREREREGGREEGGGR